MNKLLILAFFAGLTSCTSLPPQYGKSASEYRLLPQAANVRIVEFLPTADRDSFDEVEMLPCAIGQNGRTAEENLTSCKNFFRNKASQMGSTLVLLKPENVRVGVDTQMNLGNGQQMTCVNCVDAKGIILKPRAARRK